MLGGRLWGGLVVEGEAFGGGSACSVAAPVVAGGGGGVGVAHELLDGGEVGAGVEQVPGVSAAQIMGADAGGARLRARVEHAVL